MSTVTEIEEAIARLSPEERETLESRIYARKALDGLDDAERAELLASLTEAEEEIDRGDYFTGEDLRAAVKAWVSK